MSDATSHDSEELRREGLRALRDRLGVAGAARFLQEFCSGFGEYTSERAEWLDKWTGEDMEATTRGAAAEPVLGTAQDLHESLSQLAPWYRDAPPQKQHMARELVSFVVSQYRQEPKAAEGPEGPEIDFGPSRLVAIGFPASTPGLEVRLYSSLEIMRRYEAPDGLKVLEDNGCVRVQVEGPAQLGLARKWIAAAASLCGVYASDYLRKRKLLD